MAPVLTSVVPNTGPAAGTNPVTLNGSQFTGATAVTFGSAAALSYTVTSPSVISATVPPGTGIVNVTVRTPAGLSNAVTYTYAAAPTLTSIAPSQGPASGGTTVVLTGTGLTGATAVTFGSSPAASFTVNSATQITAVTPAGTGTVACTVTGPGGTSNTVFYTYLTAPVLTALSPAQGPTGAGASVTLTGTGLTTTTTVLFGSTPAAFTVISDTTVVALAPAGAAGTVAVGVTTAAGASNTLTYLRVAPPAI
ncbi:IPT/TIG domain-containing protein [Actinacidiphila yanglinensis]|uniref:IPT/TIG domain-containing protein n=1 Tax=Actinacidiphila yanglinensis TaxID=310779 RepID=A0A1H6EAR0_9ACTN|nr:IPT/TIG domain-containing protein [Actinacidiphila yanglinensis]SEG94827.1 IPT/TIG domain-containing protein [Actinacidiphila yanglinensis]